PRVPGLPLPARLDLEGTEAANFDVLAGLEREADLLEKMVHHHAHVFLGQRDALRHLLDEIGLGHGVPPPKGSGGRAAATAQTMQATGITAWKSMAFLHLTLSGSPGEAVLEPRPVHERERPLHGDVGRPED